jgi:hypothetical protein
MSCGVDEYPHVPLRLACRNRGAESKRLPDRFFEIADPKVEVSHRSLGAIDWWPDGRRDRIGTVWTPVDFDFVTPRLATGAEVTSVADVDVLVAAGITHVIDCREGFASAHLLADEPRISYLWNGVPDDGDPVTHGAAWFAKSLSFALPALARPHAKVCALCASGINRGPSTVFAILLALGVTPAEAEELVCAARPVVGLAYKVEAIASVAKLGYLDGRN